MARIGIMGGPFNPIHTGHLMLAEWAREGAELDEVWFIPTGTTYMKASLESASAAAGMPGRERLHMACLAVEDNPAFHCLDLEVQREGRTYTYETLEQLKERYPGDEFFFITGADCLFSIENWRYPQRIFQCCTLIAAVRGEYTLPRMEEKKRELEMSLGRVILLPFPAVDISSTEIRRRIRQGRSVRYLVPDRVLDYIKEKGFYREESI